MRVILSVIVIAFAACATTATSCQDDTLVSMVRSEAEARALIIREVDFSDLPDEPRRSMEAWVDNEVRKLFTGKGDAEIWYFRESKGGLGWRKGLAAVSRCRRVAEFEFSDDN